MFQKISHLAIFVKEQQEALEFYTNTIGFKKHTDALFPLDDGQQMRWLTISPENNHFEIALMLATTADQKALVGKQGGGIPVCIFITDDCKRDFEKMQGHGVVFVREPKQETWGIEALFADLYGNLFSMVQE